MKLRLLQISLLVVFIFFLGSCTNYYISLASLKQQFNGIDSSKLKEVTVQTPFMTTLHYKANPITMIKCTDKNGVTYGLENGPSIEMRVTYGYRNKRRIFFFDRVFLTSTSLIGVESRLYERIRGTIPLDSITKIEVQDGRKKYSYLNN